MNKKLKITIGIPAYNEAHNLLRLIPSIYEQNSPNYEIEKIIIISDGSNDRTAEVVNSANFPNTLVINTSQRNGKPQAMNLLFENCTSELLIQLDADVKLLDSNVLENIVHEYLNNPKIDLLLGNHAPLPSNNFVQKLGYLGFLIYKQAKSYIPDARRYYSKGVLRGFSKNLYTKLRYPISLKSSEDTYSFYYAIQSDMNVMLVEKSTAYFKLPNNISDYTKQMIRHYKSGQNMLNHFPSELVNKYDTITRTHKAKALLYYLIRTNPALTLSYILIQLLSVIRAVMHRENNYWDIAKSTK